MRTTIELSEAHRAVLLRLAAERGERGFSRFVAEALDAYLDGLGIGSERRAAAGLKGALRGAPARALAARAKSLRESWR